MNLDDFSYEENGRRYIKPEVALEEENAFIQNLRDTQAQDNAKIYQDTHNLGTDVSSNLGGLNGSEAYFNARYQTPQTNYSVANLKAAAQSKALTDVMNNELNKAKKNYSDAYNAAVKRANTPATDNNNNDNNKNENNAEEKKGEVNNENKNTIGDISFENGKTYYTIWNGKQYVLGNVPQGVAITAPFMQPTAKNPSHGTVIDYQGKKYLFANSDKSNGPKWYKVIIDTDGNFYQ